MPGFVSVELRDAVDGRPLMLADHSARMGDGLLGGVTPPA